MDERKFKPLMLLILALPLVVSVIGGIITNTSAMVFFSGGGYQGVNQFDIYIGASLLCGIMAFLLYWGKKNYALMAAIILPVLYAIYAYSKMGTSQTIFSYFVPILLLSLLIFVLLWKVFYSSLFARLRTFIFSLGAAVAYDIFFWLLYLMLGQEIEAGFWMTHFVNGLILFVFIALGLSIADMIIVGREIKELQAIRRQKILNDEIDDEEDDAL